MFMDKRVIIANINFIYMDEKAECGIKMKTSAELCGCEPAHPCA